MSRFVINYFRVSTSQFSSINIFCPDNETIFDMYRLVILKESHKRYIDEAYFKNNYRSELLNSYMNGKEFIPRAELEDYLDDMPNEIVKELFDNLYTSWEGVQKYKPPRDWFSISIEEYKEPEFLGTGDYIYI